MQNFDLIIIGSGSGNAIPAELDHLRIALVERDVFGGTCLNRGCIPSKMLVYAADQALAARSSQHLGVHMSVDHVDWPGIVDRVFGRIDPIAEGGQRYRIDDCDNIEVFGGSGVFVDHKVLEVNGQRITAPSIVLAAGARPYIPPVNGLADVPFHTSDTIMRLPELPRRLAILGGGYIACELGHVFDAFGSEVTIINRGPNLLRSEDADISARFTELAAQRFDLRTGRTVERVERAADGSVRILVRGDEPLEVDAVLVATGRIPNSDQLAVSSTGVNVDHSGRVVVDEHLQTSVEGIWALGDIANHHQLKHVANAEARVVFHNVAHPEDLRVMDYGAVPHAVFGNPQVASVGLTEGDAASASIPFEVGRCDYGATAYGWAMEDTTSFAKVIAHAQTRQILGAHIVGSQASTLIQPLIQAMRFGQTVEEVAAGQMWIHPALTEVVENALLDV